MNWKFWKNYTLSVTSKIGSLEITHTATAPTKEEAQQIIRELQEDSS